MTQSKLVKKMYVAQLQHNSKKLAKLRKKEFSKIFKNREEGVVCDSTYIVTDY